MKEAALVIPFKGRGYKSRLSSILSPAQRKRFALLLLRDVLDSVADAGMMKSCFVVTSDAGAMRAAVEAGARVVRERADAGVSAAVEEAMRVLPENEEFIVVPADLPTLRPADLGAVATLMKKGPRVVLAPSRAFDGTNLFCFRRSDRVALSYDKDSFWNHLASSARKGLSVAVYSGKGAMFDVDAPADLRELASLRINTRSAALAREVLSRRRS